MSCKEVGFLQVTITLLSISARASDARNLSGLRANFASLAGAARSSGKETRGSSAGDLGCPWLARAPGKQEISLSWDPVAKGGPASGRALSPCFAKD